MNNNIFKETKFGDKFVTRDGHCACLIGKSSSSNGNLTACAINYSEYGYIVQSYKKDGTVYDVEDCFDIVSRYQEPINEDKLDELVHNYTPLNEGDMDSFTHEQSTNITKWIDEAYKAGYRKAMEG